MALFQSTANVLVPKVYHYECEDAKQPQLTTMIIMEDLSDNSAIVNMADGISLEQVTVLVTRKHNVYLLSLCKYLYKYLYKNYFIQNFETFL